MLPADSKVLLVDDDPAMLRILSKWLEKAGYPVRTATDGHQALALIEADRPDILITDWEMPRMDGLELCRRVRQMRLPHYLYILFLTVKSTSESVVAGLEVGADDFLTKPVDQAELLARMRAGMRVLDLEHRLSLLARTDPLTGLMTQRSFYELLEKEWQRSKRYQLPLSCVMIDLDFFKRINDTHGHPAGDAVLKAVADLLTAGSRSCDSVCRHGGEEFCAMLPETNEAAAAFWAERLRRQLGALVVPIAGKELRITGSFGVAQQRDDMQLPESLVDQADQALLCAKHSGRDRVVCFDELGEGGEHELDQARQHKSLFHGIVARDVMTPLVACLRAEETVGQAAEFFLSSRINSAPVVDENNRLVGMISEKDLLAAMISLDCWQRPIRDYMKPNVISYEEQTAIRIIYEFLCRVSIRRVVIVRDGQPTGTISRGTLLRWFRNLVIGKGLLELPGESGPRSAVPIGSRQRLTVATGELARRIYELEGQLREKADDLVPLVVGSVSGMQELLNDLLAYSADAERSDGSKDGRQDVVVAGSCVD
jgi:two-component system, cell cycle response regulator